MSITHRGDLRHTCGALGWPLLLAVLPAAEDPSPLTVGIGPQGLTALIYQGVDFAIAEGYGRVALASHPNLTKAAGKTTPVEDQRKTVVRTDETITQTYAWGQIVTTYDIKPSQLTLRVKLSKETGESLSTVLRLFSLRFAQTPEGHTLNVGMWGNGGDDPLGSYPMAAFASGSPPILAITTGTTSLHFFMEPSYTMNGVSIPFSLDGEKRSIFPFDVSPGDIPVKGAKEAVVSLRFGPQSADANPFASVEDVIVPWRQPTPASCAGTTIALSA